MYRIFVAEDDPAIARAIQEGLTHWGYEVRIAQDLQRVGEEFAAYAPHLALMDLSLPFYNGFHWCQEIRKTSKAPVVFISSAADNMNIVLAMHLGGDDFIPKPFDLSVLAAKVQALLRRAYDFAPEPPPLTFAGGTLCPESGVLRRKEGDVPLTRNEARILQALLEKRGQVVSRGEIMARLWESDSFVDENTLSVNVNRLRKTLEEAGVPARIQTRRGEGYCIDGE